MIEEFNFLSQQLEELENSNTELTTEQIEKEYSISMLENIINYITEKEIQIHSELKKETSKLVSLLEHDYMGDFTLETAIQASKVKKLLEKDE